MDPLEAVAQIKDEVLARADFLVVLADLPRDAKEFSEGSPVHNLASRHDEIAAILLTERRYVLFPAQLINHAVVLSSVERGRQLPSLTISLDAEGRIAEFANDFADLEEGVPEDSDWKLKQDALAARFP